ncbi:LytTr DNA-binding domain-containing protein [Spirosomataceae bacterium TFI 002]|nr:LytTr DNA-binding domain-containing protein [Spirosomataceae bacterium TFI 002]
MKPKQIENANKIMFLRGDVNYTDLFFENGKYSKECVTLKRFEEQLEGFVRVSRSYLVNPRFIHKVVSSPNYCHLEMKNGKEVVVSRRKLPLVKPILALV